MAEDDHESTETRLARVLTFRSPDSPAGLQEALSASEVRILPDTNYEKAYDTIAKQLLSHAKAWTGNADTLLRQLQIAVSELEIRGAQVEYSGTPLEEVAARCQRDTGFLQVIEQILVLLREKPDGFDERVLMALEHWAKAEKAP